MPPKKVEKKKEGRPLFDGKDEKIVLQKLEEVWAIGGTDEEACFYADISVTALSEYQKKHPEVSERKKRLKQNPILKARTAVVNGFNEDRNLAFKFLERKRRKEFGEEKGISVNFALEFSSKIADILSKRLPDKCPHCNHLLGVKEAIATEIETLSTDSVPALQIASKE